MADACWVSALQPVMTEALRPESALTPFAGSEAGQLYVISPDVTACPLGDGIALFDSRTDSYFTLNQSGALLWVEAARPVALSALKQALARAFGRSEEVLSEDVDQVVRALLDAGLLHLVSNASHTAGSSA